MTEGIIQKVFRNEMMKFEYLDEVMVSNFLELQQELIKEIGKEFPSNDIPEKNCDIEMIPVGHINATVNRILIGDTKE